MNLYVYIYFSKYIEILSETQTIDNKYVQKLGKRLIIRILPLR